MTSSTLHMVEEPLALGLRRLQIRKRGDRGFVGGVVWVLSCL